MIKSIISFTVVVPLILLPSYLHSQETENELISTDEDTLIKEEVSETKSPEELDNVESELVDNASDEVSSIEKGYRGLPWGTSSSEFKNFIQFDSSSAQISKDNISFTAPLGNDTVNFIYSFSDSGFWKVKMDFSLKRNSIEDYIKEFQRIEQLLTKKYGNPLRTTRNDLGTSREYLSSSFPRLFRGYYRSSWIVDKVSIELLLEIQMQDPEFQAPVFSEDIPSMRLYYYHTEFYGITKLESTEIPEEDLLKQF
ncbi:MAG: hypothetical protein ACE5EE_04405 [Fidelibacterota bacterium]